MSDSISDPTTIGEASAAEQTREQRERRVDHVHTIAFGDRVEVDCPSCGASTTVGIYGDQRVSFGRCWGAGCDAFHKFQRRAYEVSDSDETQQTQLVTDGGVDRPSGEGEQDDAETIVRQTERTMHGTTASVTIEVDNDGHLSDDDRLELAIALLEEGQNTDFADWDDAHPVPTVNNRVI